MENSLKHRLIMILRGRHKSVRRRFILEPRERLKEFAVRLSGKSWIEFYADRLDGYAGKQSLESVREGYLPDGQAHLDYMIRFGLKPHHKVFDFGCGFGRTARFLADYLDPGNYVGADISKERLRIANELIRTNGLEGKNPLFLTNRDNRFDWLQGRKFDFIWSQSVFNHMPDEDIQEALKNIHKIMNPEAVLFIIPLHDRTEAHTERRTVKDWARGFNYYRNCVGRYGLRCELLDDENRFGNNMGLKIMTVGSAVPAERCA